MTATFRKCHDCEGAIKGLPKRQGISQRKLEDDAFRIATHLYVRNYGGIPVIKGDPKVMPIKAQVFVAEKARLLQPRAIYICDGSRLESEYFMRKLKGNGVARDLTLLENCHLVITDPRDASSMPMHPMIASEGKHKPESNKPSGARSAFARCASPYTMDNELDERFPAAMAGRVMYVIPFSLGPIGGLHSINGIQLTDSTYIAMMTAICVRVSPAIWDCLEDKSFVRCIHSLGVQRPIKYPLKSNWPCVPEFALLATSPEKREVWSYGTGSESAILAKNEVPLRIGSIIAKQEGWLAEHMAIIALTAPDKRQYFIGIAGPNSTGKTSMAFLKPSLPEWKVETIGEQVAWIRVGSDGKMYAVNPHNGFIIHISGFRPTKNTSEHYFSKNATFVNVGRTGLGKPCWAGTDISGDSSSLIYDWRGNPWSSSSNKSIEHPHASVAVRCKDCPGSVYPEWDSGKGVPLSAIIFNTRRSNGIPLVYESFSWRHGVFQASILRTDSTAEFVHPDSCDTAVYDPMGIARYLGYSVGEYITHWLSFDKPTNKLPKIFFMNLFLRGEKDNNYIWPGFGENIRILQWITQRLSGGGEETAIESPLGLIPKPNSVNLDGLNVNWDELMAIPKPFWQTELRAARRIYGSIYGDYIPQSMAEELKDLEKRLARL